MIRLHYNSGAQRADVIVWRGLAKAVVERRAGDHIPRAGDGKYRRGERGVGLEQRCHKIYLLNHEV